MTKQSYQIIIYTNLFIYLVRSRSRFLTKITAPAPAPAEYGGSTASGSATLLLINHFEQLCNYFIFINLVCLNKIGQLT